MGKLQQGQNWNLFGYDVRQLLRHWRAAWREFLWGYESPVKARLDEQLIVHSEAGTECFHAGHRVDTPVGEQEHEKNDLCEAVILPANLVLTRILVMPVAVESDLDTVMTLEVSANSPFPENDTGYGWKLVSRDDKNLQIQLAIVSLSSAMSYLGRQYQSHDASTREIWAEVDGAIIELMGFGEKKRLQRYNKRLIRVAIAIAYCSLLLVVITGGAAAAKYLELQQVRNESDSIRSQAKSAMKMRTTIVNANETIATVNALIAQRPSPHFELVRLSALLGDDASILQITIQGRTMDLRGIADDAAVVVQQLTDEASYVSVVSPQAITPYFNSGQQQFFLNIELSAETPQ